MAGRYNDSKTQEDEAFFLSRNDLINRWGNIISSWSMLPGLVGFWPMSSVQRSTGNAYDLSGQGRTLTYNGNPTYNIYNSIMPYIDLDGVGDFLSRADETDLDILGTEAIYAAAVRGLTLGGWFWWDVLGAAEGTMSKDDNGVQRSYRLIKTSTNLAQFGVSLLGAATVVVTSVGAFSASAWYFVVGRFVPSTTLDVYVNNNKFSNAVGIPASIFNSTTAFNIGGLNGGALMNGRASLCFLSANALPDALIGMLFNQSRVLFGV